jgi:HEAT repeat protein
MSRVRSKLTLGLLLVLALTASSLAGTHLATSDGGSERRSEAYREGQRALEREAWGDASIIFGKIADGSGEEADAAMYWKAYADWKRQQKKEALEGLRKLLSAYPKSTWADDAKALEIEIRGGKGSGGTTSAEDEELKLYALDGLMQIKPEQAVPVLERLLGGSSSLRIKQRALFVLSQSPSPKAREILVRIAKTGQPLELRREAVKTLGIAGDAEDIAALASIARDTSAPIEVREAVIEAYLISGRQEELFEIAKSDPDPRIRLKAVETLGAMGALPALRKLWATEQDPKIRGKLLEAFGIAGDVETLTKAARESSDPQIRRKAIEGLGISSGPAASKALRQLYGEYSNSEDKRKVVEGFMIHGDATTLVELFRAEKDPGMRKYIIQQLSVMNDPEATRVILDVLGERP